MGSSKGIILTIDDMVSIRTMMAMIVTKLGFEVIQAENGAIGLEKAADIRERHLPLKMVIVDINMPKMNGIEFTREFRKHDKTTPIMFLTTESEMEKVQQGKEAGGNAWSVKPIKYDDLVEAIEAFTEI